MYSKCKPLDQYVTQEDVLINIKMNSSELGYSSGVVSEAICCIGNHNKNPVHPRIYNKFIAFGKYKKIWR